ncbi:hypothetical protein [Cytobacillus kochii]|uniref:hypothetical protein n=1 Tax=Cytobacillus kochii TaxID=859143 RepID=UPI002480AF1A|nr:hypothetical protein [Cytobacillus kochii]
MEQQVIQILVYIIRAVQLVALSYAALKLSIYGVGYMKKNMQKVEEAKDGMKNVAIGLVVVLGCQAFVKFLDNGISF